MSHELKSKLGSLIIPELTIINTGLLETDGNQSNVLFGTGLVAGKKLTEGLPFDFLGYLLAAERARRAFSLRGIVHLIADDYAEQEVPERASEIACLTGEILQQCQKLSRMLGMNGRYTAVLSSAIHAESQQFATLFEAASAVEQLNLEIPNGSLRYVRLQLADMEYLRLSERGLLKLSWVVNPGRPLHNSKGFDERLFDNAYARVFGTGLSYVYTSSGVTFDSQKPRASPYVAVNPAARMMLWPTESDFAAKLRALSQKGGNTAIAALDHLSSIVSEFEALIEPLPGEGWVDKIVALAEKLK